MNEKQVTALVAVQNVKKSFVHEGREVPILRGIDLSIDEGEMLCIVGPSGAGKSTLLHLLGTLDLPSEGRILIGGEDVTQYSSSKLADFRNRSIGFVFQFHHLLPEFTALENVMMPGRIRGEAGPALESRARELLAEAGLEKRVTHRPGELSGGEQQRVALARALIMNPRLVLADEPTGNLDSTTSKAMHDLMFGLNKSRGTTFLVVTHSGDLAEQMPRVVHMRDGRVEDDRRN
jgi:lipoprotein-releasing system ATP-binding protein